MSYLDKLPKPFFVLAPMYDVTDTVFRQVVGECAPPDLYFTEFVNADGLQSAGRKKIDFRLRFNKTERPIIAQIWGKTPANYYKTAADLVDMGFDGIDINMGCPDKAVLKNGCCGALIDNHKLAEEIILATRKGADGKIPISVKTRIGFSEFDEGWLKFLLGLGLPMLSVHLRTVREMSKVPAHWELTARICELRDQISDGTLLVANGDIETKHQGAKLAADHNLDGIMIGRGVFSDPFVFASESSWSRMQPAEKINLYKKHVEQFKNTWQKNERPIITLNKFCKIYIRGFDGAKELRESLVNCKSADDLLHKLDEARLDV